jgi:uncharacterized protein
MEDIKQKLAREFNVNISNVENVISLLDGGNTVPFIARYRKEMTGSMSDVILRDLSERLTYLRNLNARKDDVIRLIDEQGKLTEELKSSIMKSETLTEVEDLYRPYKAKKRTRATIAQEKGLKPLADVIFSGTFKDDIMDIAKYAESFIDAEKDVNSGDDALKGAMDIISEIISDEAEYRKWIRSYVKRQGILETTSKKRNLLLMICIRAIRSPYEIYPDTEYLR